MFKKKEYTSDNTDLDYSVMNSVENIDKHKTNSILKGSKLTGDILISCDLQLDGDVEGKITAEQQSNVVIKGNCRGSINVKEGNVDIEGQMSDGDIIAGGNVSVTGTVNGGKIKGQMSDGDIIAGGNVSVTGTFNGGKIEAKGKISVNGKFNGTLNGREIEIGPDAQGTGDLFYRESISIAKGASVEIQIKKTGELQKKPKELADAEVVNIEPSVRAAIG